METIEIIFVIAAILVCPYIVWDAYCDRREIGE